MQLDDLVEILTSLPDEQLLAVLHRVFLKKRPNPEEDAYNKNRFFLGTASSMLESEEDQPVQWGDWEIHAVAYIDTDKYGQGSLGPTEGFCQFGMCQVCHTRVRSNVKSGICPICFSKVYMT